MITHGIRNGCAFVRHRLNVTSWIYTGFSMNFPRWFMADTYGEYGPYARICALYLTFATGAGCL